MDLSERIQSIQSKVKGAALRSKRNPSDIHLIAVSKTQPLDCIQKAVSEGLSLFGENRIEEAEDKVKNLPDCQWHLIGHLQSRKVKKALPLFELIHSVDSEKLIEKINQEAQNQGIEKVAVLLQLNISGEESKYGFSEEALGQLLSRLAQWKHVEVKGLMTLAPLSEDPEASRPLFRRLKEILVEANQKEPELKLSILSMGMSQDFEVAIEEGATHVRVGTRLFKGDN